MAEREIGTRSIPAGAGEPKGSHGAHCVDAVHPRWRGGALFILRPPPPSCGPSPLARGSLRSWIPRTRMRGSIPAGAGEPVVDPVRRGGDLVHPRWRGGAFQTNSFDGKPYGPSPLARGSPGRGRLGAGDRGSIPAGAGEPPRRRSATRWRRVHPRWRGGAKLWPVPPVLASGPSPLARGSRDQAQRHDLRVRSIPAGAGEPKPFTISPGVKTVHPRWRGGA